MGHSMSIDPVWLTYPLRFSWNLVKWKSFAPDHRKLNFFKIR